MSPDDLHAQRIRIEALEANVRALEEHRLRIEALEAGQASLRYTLTLVSGSLASLGADALVNGRKLDAASLQLEAIARQLSELLAANG